jgi:hypothetical protein
MTSSIPQKSCSKCKQSFPQTPEFFALDKTNKKTGLRSYCKSCGLAMATSYYERNRAKVLEAKRIHRIENHDAYVQRDRERYLNTLEYQKQRHAAYRAINHDKYLEYMRGWRIENADKIKAYSKRYYKDHAHAMRAKSRKYYQEHYEEIIEKDKLCYQWNRRLF